MARSVRAFRGKIASGDIPISNVKSSSVYSDITPFKRFSDLKLHINEFVYRLDPELSDNEGFRIANVPLIPSDEVAAMRRDKSVNYVHWGALSVSIDALFRKKAGVTGICYVFDSRWKNAEQALCQSFEFSLDSGSATMITQPNFSVALSDNMISQCLNVAVIFNNLNFKREATPISIRVGMLYRYFDSFLSAVVLKDESNVEIDSNSAEKLYLDAVGINAEAVLEAFKYTEGVEMQQVRTQEFSVPSGLFGARKKFVKQRSFVPRDNTVPITFPGNKALMGRKMKGSVRSESVMSEENGSNIELEDEDRQGVEGTFERREKGLKWKE
uniref:Movement protein n=1 Tax=Scaevola virus A TaxID=1046302 RepID=G9FIH1_9VIRU|nr:movement protein [Scaevola virus A]